MKLQLSFLFALTLALVGCDAINKFLEKTAPDDEQNEEAPIETGEAPPPASPPFIGCDNGTKPQVLKGNCEGKWVVKKGQAGNTCEFEWGPTIKCPENTKSVTYEAVCYGTTVKSESSKDIRTAADCKSKFGEKPTPSTYELECCPI